jgi:hypothetical protein
VNTEHEESEPFMAYMSTHEWNTFQKMCKKMTNKKMVQSFRKKETYSVIKEERQYNAKSSSGKAQNLISQNLCTKKGNKTTTISTNHLHQS